MTIPAYLSNSYYLSVLAFMGTRFMMALGLSLLVGQAGQISLGQAGFVGIGAYGSAILTTRLGLEPLAGDGLGGHAGGVIAGLVGMPTLKLKGYYLAMATLGVNEIIYILLVQLKSLTNGTDGITGIPSLRIGGLDLGTPRAYHLRGLGRGPADVALRSEPVAVAGGPLSAGPAPVGAGGGVAGGRHLLPQGAGVHAGGGVREHRRESSMPTTCTTSSPDGYGIAFSIILITGVIIGGLGSIWGALWGTLVIVILPELLKRVNEDITNLVFGVLLVAIMILWQGRTQSAAGACPRVCEQAGGAATVASAEAEE